MKKNIFFYWRFASPSVIEWAVTVNSIIFSWEILNQWRRREMCGWYDPSHHNHSLMNKQNKTEQNNRTIKIKKKRKMAGDRNGVVLHVILFFEWGPELPNNTIAILIYYLQTKRKKKQLIRKVWEKLSNMNGAFTQTPHLFRQEKVRYQKAENYKKQDWGPFQSEMVSSTPFDDESFTLNKTLATYTVNTY